MQSIVEVVCVGSGSNKTYNSVYTDPGYCKMVIVQDDDKFPSPRLCLLRRWPNFEGGFGFNLYEDLISSTGALKVEEVVRHSPAEAGGLRKNDVIIEINGDNIEFKSFFRLVEILKEACSRNELELLVLAEQDAEWYRIRNICVNSNFPNIEYCETPYYGHILKPLESLSQVNLGNNTNVQPRMGTSQIEFHSSTGKLYRTTLVIDKEKDSVYRRIEELPSSSSATTQSADQLAQQSMAPLRPDGTYRHPSNDTSSVRVYYRRDREFLNNTIKTGGIAPTGDDSGHGSISNRRSTPLSTTTGVNMNTASMSPYSTLGKSMGEQVDLLTDKWADLMDKYLDNKFRSSSSASGHQGTIGQQDEQPDRDVSAGGTKRNYTIRLHDPNVSAKKSRGQSPNADNSFSFLNLGRDDYQTASATSFRERQLSPYQHLLQQQQQNQRGSPQTQSNRYPSPLHSVQSPTRSTSRPHPQRHTSLTNNQSIGGSSHIGQSETTATSSSSSPLFQQYESSSFSTHSTSTSHHHKAVSSDDPLLQQQQQNRAPHNIILRPKAISTSLGFQLDENEILAKGYYFVKYVDPNSASAQAGLKEGDKITKINGKSTGGMSYDEFCNEIAIAQQQQLKNNMIHLMVMRRSAKHSAASTGSTSSVSANALSSMSGTGSSGIGPTVLPIKNNLYDKTKQKPAILTSSTSSNLVDEGYVPETSSATSSSHTAALGDSSTSNIPYNLVSVIKVTSPNARPGQEVEQVKPPTKPVVLSAHTIQEIPSYETYNTKISRYPVIYDNGDQTHVATTAEITNDYDQSFTIDDSSANIPELPKSPPPESPTFQRIKYQDLLEKQEREREKREQELREQRQRDEQREREREKERLEKERREQEQQQLELERIKNAEREQREREQRERERREKELAENRKKQPFRVSEQQGIESLTSDVKQKQDDVKPEQSSLKQALAAVTAITALGSEPIQTTHYQIDDVKPEKLKEIQSEREKQVLPEQYKPTSVEIEQPQVSKVTSVSQQQQPQQPSNIIISSVYTPERLKETSPESVTITAIGLEPIKSTTATVAQSTKEEPINITVEKKKPQPVQQYPALVNEETTTTTTITKSVSQIHELREETIEVRDNLTGEVDKKVLQSEIISQSVHESDEPISTKPHKAPIKQEEISTDDSSSQISVDQQELIRQELLERQLHAEEPHGKRDRSLLTYKLHKLPITDDLKHIVDIDSSNINNNNTQEVDSNLNTTDLSTSSDLTLRQPSLTEFDESQYIKKLFIFKKTLATDASDGKQQSLAQIIKNLNKDSTDQDQSESSESTSTASAYAPPYPLGIRLKNKSNPLEIGNHVISIVEPGSPADLAGLKVNSRLHKLNDVVCDDKTHEFVLFYLNYILRKNTCHSIEMIVDEPFIVKPQRASLTSRSSQLRDAEKAELISSETGEPTRIHSALAALTKIVGVGAEETDETGLPKNDLIQSSNDLLTTSDNLLSNTTSIVKAGTTSSGSNENLKAIIQSIIWRPPFHKSDGSLFHSDSVDSNLSNTQFSYANEDDLNSNLKGIFKEVLTHNNNNTNINHSIQSLDIKDKESDDNKLTANLIPSIIDADTAQLKPVENVDIKLSEQIPDEKITKTISSSSDVTGIHSAFAALTKITSLGATGEQLNTANSIQATVTSFSQQQEQQHKILASSDQKFESASSVVIQAAQASSLQTSESNSLSTFKQDTQQQFVYSENTNLFSDQKITHKADPSNIQSALAALTKITSFGNEDEEKPQPQKEDKTEKIGFLPLPYPYGSAQTTSSKENENLKSIIIEATNIDKLLKETTAAASAVSGTTSIHLPYPYGTIKDDKQNDLNDKIVTSLIDGGVSKTIDETNKSKTIQSALAALTKITAFGADSSDEQPSSHHTNTTSTNYEVLPIGIGNQESSQTSFNKQTDELSESDLIKIYKYQEEKFNRQQQVMNSLVVAMDNPQLNGQLRTYSLYKSEHFFGYGIAFHTEDIAISESYHKLVYPLIEIEPQSPAEEAGMQNGQRVVAVNGEFVNKEFKTLEDVVQAIEDSYYSRNFTEITVLEPQFWDEFMENPEIATQLANYVKQQQPSTKPADYASHLIDSVIDNQQSVVDKAIPRLCRLSRESRADQYGFDFKTLKNEGKHVANNVRPDFPADKAGLRDGDYILEVNGESIDNIEHDNVVSKISAQPTQVDLLVVADLAAYLASRPKPTQPVVTTPVISTKPTQIVDIIEPIIKKDEISRHELKLIPDSGLGISLASGGIINSVEPNSPAERAGLKKDSKIVEVNGIDVSNKSNKEIAKAIKENEKKLVIGVVKVEPKVEPSSVTTTAVDDKSGSRADLTSSSTLKMGKMSGSSSNLLYLKSKFGSCLRLKSSENKHDSEEEQPTTSTSATTSPEGVRICNLINRPDFDGFGFSMRGNEKGPHQISNVEANSPAEYAGLKNEDLILKVNDVNVVGERYNKTVALIKNESEKGRLKLEVIEPSLCPADIRNIVLTPQSGFSTLNRTKPSKSGSIDNLRSIASEIIASGSGRDTVRSVSQIPSERDKTTSDRRPRPASTSDIDRVPQLTNSTVRSNVSYASTATFSSDIRPSNVGSTRSVSSNLGGSTTLGYKPKFKRCHVQLLPDFNGYGFAINSKMKPKFMIYSVDPNSPAYKANLRETDVIVQIDNKNIRRMKFDKVKQLLSESTKKGYVEILAIDDKGYKYYKNKKKNFSSKKLVTPDNTEPFSTISSTPQTRERTQSTDIDESTERSRTASSSKIQNPVTTTDQPSMQQVPTTSAETSTGTVMDNFEIIACTVVRDGNHPLGLSLSTARNRSESAGTRASSAGSRRQDEDVILPIITSVDAGSPADRAGLRANDLILEINGSSTTGQTNSTVGKWIKSSGDQIEFLVSREKVLTYRSPDNEIILRSNARKIALEAVEAAQSRVTAEDSAAVGQLTPTRLSRRESAALSNRSGKLTPQSSPNLVHAEIRMSSSRLQQELPKDENVISPAGESSPIVRPRNQSEPTLLAEDNQLDTSKSGPTSTSLSRRSASSYNLPNDAPIPRLCRVRAYEDQLGFTVAGSKTNRGVFKVNDVTANSPAAHSGLRNEDQIIEISGVNVESMTYNEVIDYIKERKQEDDLQLLVADRATYQWYKAKKIPISSHIVPKMQYIETLLKEELQADLNAQTNSENQTNTS